MYVLANLPVDSILSITNEDFVKFDLANKLKNELSLAGLEECSLVAWYFV